MVDLPQAIEETGEEDIQGVDNAIDSLYSKFISPIEAIRSISEAPVGPLLKSSKENYLADLKIDVNRPFESRASAFYRMLGFPIVDKNNNFYNPGFDPYPIDTNTDKDSINENLDFDVRNSLEKRDSEARLTRDLFLRQDVACSLYALVQRHPKPFNTLEKSDQSFTVDARSQEVADVYAQSSTLTSLIDDAFEFIKNYPVSIGVNFDQGKHLLKPFMVNPAVDLTVTPSSRKICVPFLSDKNSTKISSSPDVYLSRPGIEFIIRSRLKDSTQDQLFLHNVQQLLSKSKKQSSSNNDVKTQTLQEVILALAGTLEIPSSDIEKTFSFSNTQTYIIRQLLSLLKLCVFKLHNYVSELDKIKRQIQFLPLPGDIGPEKIGSNKEDGSYSPVDRAISRLEIKKLNAERDNNLSQFLGDFATPFSNLERTTDYEEEIQRLSLLKKELGDKGLHLLRNIEIITGEVSGLGLVDILAIYTALWSIDIEYLLGFLDQASFTRLYTLNSDLHTQAVQDRFNGNSLSISTVLAEFEKKVKNILSFADKLLESERSSPTASVRGNPT